MTIYKPKGGDKKAVKVVPLSQKVVPDDVMPLANGKKIDQLEAHLVVIHAAKRRRNRMMMMLALLLLICFLIITAVAGLFIFRHMQKRPYMGICDVRFHEGNYEGQFQEQVEVDNQYGVYEKLEVPPVLDSRKSVIVHDFDKNLTAIVDRDHGRCFILDLNRTVVQPPKNFLDLLQKFQSGYYVPDATVVREKYRVATPQIENLEPLGIYIWNECQYFETYRLVHENQPFAMSRKRSVSSKHFEGVFSLGDTLGNYLPLVEIIG